MRKSGACRPRACNRPAPATSGGTPLTMPLPTAIRRLGAVIACAATLPAAHADADLLADNQLTLGATVWGIVSYTRWPVAPNPLRVCVAGRTSHTEAIRRTSDWVGPERVGIVRTLAADEDPAQACDLVYAGVLPAATLTHLIGRVAGKPVLTIGEGPDFCTAGGMFCLEGLDGGVRFSANLDAISRSELRINPQVLRLSRRLRGLGS